MSNEPQATQDAVREDFARVSADFRRLLDQASTDDLRRKTAGTRWTNEELLFHMLFGYLVVRSLLPLVRLFSRLPAGAGRTYSRALDATTKSFDQINYLGPVLGSRILNRRRMATRMDRTLAAIQRQCDRETADSLTDAMHFPTRWDPFFRDRMTLADVYRYPTRHYDFHRDQLTLDGH
jgi:hypothetical protein